MLFRKNQDFKILIRSYPMSYFKEDLTSLFEQIIIDNTPEAFKDKTADIIESDVKFVNEEFYLLVKVAYV